jgi:hypothetical protein
LQPVRTSAATTTETRNRTGDVRLIDAQKSAITRSVARGGDLIEQRTLNFNSKRRQEYAASEMAMRIIEGICRQPEAQAHQRAILSSWFT